MSDSLRVFNNPEFGSVRTVTVDGEPWFVVADVCAYFGVTNRNRVMQMVDDDEKGGTQIDTPGGTQTIAIVNESGLYALLFALQPTKARGVSEEYIEERQKKLRSFKRWVTHDVLPAIRKTGTYTARTMTPNEIIAAIAADNVEKERRLKALEDGFHEAMEVLAEPPEAEEWRKKIYQKVSRYCARHDLDYTETWEKLYGQLEIRAGCNLATLQTRRRNRARIAGATASAVNAINRLDCIAADKRLREIFTSIVKEFSARRILASSVAPETPADPYVFPALA